MTSRVARIVALTTHAREVPSEERERFAVDAARAAGAANAILVRTCHRVELYAVEGGPNGERAWDEARLPALPGGGHRLSDGDAVRHLLRVAAGLDSVVIGEDQILHQVREALGARHVPAPAVAPIAPELERLFQIAFRVGRETRSWREGAPRSLADVALDRAGAGLAGAGSAAQDCSGLRHILLVGAGRMGRLVALAAQRRDVHVTVMNRTVERAGALAVEIGGDVLPADHPLDWRQFDAVIVAIASSWALDAGSAARLAAATIPVVDLSSPPAVAADLRAMLRSRYTSIDDLAAAPQAALRDRLQQRFERLSADACDEFDRWLQARAAVPTIRKLADQAEAHRTREIERLLDRMPNLEPHERDLVDQMSRRLVATILHEPLSTLHDDTSGELARAARALFAL